MRPGWTSMGRVPPLADSSAAGFGRGRDAAGRFGEADFLRGAGFFRGAIGVTLAPGGPGCPSRDRERPRSGSAQPLGGLDLPDSLGVDGEEEQRLLRLALVVEAGLPRRPVEVLH